MWRRRWTDGYIFHCLLSAVTIAACLAGQVCLALDRQAYCVRITSPSPQGGNFVASGAVIDSTATEYLIATCTHAGEGGPIFAQLNGTSGAHACRAVWIGPRNQLDAALWAVRKQDVGWNLPDLPEPAGRPGVGEYLQGWGYGDNTPRPRHFGGTVHKTGIQYAQGSPGVWDAIRCRVVGGDSGSVVWTQDGRPAGIIWGCYDDEPPASSIYTSLAVLEASRGPTESLGIRQAVCWPQQQRPVGRPPQGVIICPRLEPPPQPVEPPCCDELRQVTAANGLAIEEVRANVVNLNTLLERLQLQLAELPAIEPPDLSAYVTRSDLADALGPYATKSDLAGMESRLNLAINNLTNLVNRPLPGPTEHIAIAVNPESSYWRLLSENIESAREHYAHIRVAYPSETVAGTLPTAVRYVNGTSHGIYEGLEEVERLLSEIRRGNTPPDVGGDP